MVIPIYNSKLKTLISGRLWRFHKEIYHWLALTLALTKDVIVCLLYIDIVNTMKGSKKQAVILDGKFTTVCISYLLLTLVEGYLNVKYLSYIVCVHFWHMFHSIINLRLLVYKIFIFFRRNRFYTTDTSIYNVPLILVYIMRQFVVLNIRVL